MRSWSCQWMYSSIRASTSPRGRSSHFSVVDGLDLHPSGEALRGRSAPGDARPRAARQPLPPASGRPAPRRDRTRRHARRSCRRGSRPAARGTPFPSPALIPVTSVSHFPFGRPAVKPRSARLPGARVVSPPPAGTVPAPFGRVRHEPAPGHDPADRLPRDAGPERGLDPAAPVAAPGISEHPRHLLPEPGVPVNPEPGVTAVGGRPARCRASTSPSRANTPGADGRPEAAPPCPTGAAGRRPGPSLRPPPPPASPRSPGSGCGPRRCARRVPGRPASAACRPAPARPPFALSPGG